MQERKLNGHAVKALREVLGLPGGEFAIACGMSHSQLSNIEAGRKQASAEAAHRICAQLQAAMPMPIGHRLPIDVRLAITYPTALEATG